MPQQVPLQLASTHWQFTKFWTQAFSGSSQSVSAVPRPEQHAFGEVGSVSEPTHVQTPPLHMPEMHACASVHAAPFWSEGVWQTPASQYPDWQSPSPVQGPPSGFVPHVPSMQTPDVHASAPAHGCPSAAFAAQVPAWQKPDAQSPSAEHEVPSGCSPHSPSTHALVRHSGELVHGCPSGRPHPPW